MTGRVRPICCCVSIASKLHRSAYTNVGCAPHTHARHFIIFNEPFFSSSSIFFVLLRTDPVAECLNARDDLPPGTPDSAACPGIFDW